MGKIDKKHPLPKQDELIEITDRYCSDKVQPSVKVGASYIVKRTWKELCEIAKGKCPEDTLKAFFSYWSEPTASASPEERKMRYELQRVWNTASRLAAWIRNERKPTTRAPSATTPQNATAAQNERETQQRKREAEYADRKSKCVTREKYLEMVRNGEIKAAPTANT